MFELFLVIARKGQQTSKKRFNIYGEACDFAFSECSKGCSCIVLSLNNETLKWQRKLTLYPSETC